MTTYTKGQTTKLYNIKHSDFTNRTKREKNLLEILDKIKLLKPNANVRDIRLKLQTIRSQYCQEKKPGIEIKKSGAQTLVF